MRGLRLNILFVSRPGQRTQPLSLIEESYFIVTHVIFWFTTVRVALLFYRNPFTGNTSGGNTS